MDGSEVRAPAPAAYRVLARKYRPQTFTDLVGQEAMVRTLTNAFAIGRIAQAYMLTGVRGVGKTTTARILARALNYSIPGQVGGPTIDMPEFGEHCAAIIEGRHVDVIEMDAASHTGINDIREIIEASRYKPAIARYKVYIIDEVHMLSTAAFNGLLKTLEEPPEHVKFIFATTEIRKVPVTVLSRCQRFDLKRLEPDRLADLLQRTAAAESVEIDETALAMLARAAEGSARDGLSLLDQAIAHAAGRIEAEAVRGMLGLADRAKIIDLFEAALRGDAPTALAGLAEQHAAGADPAVVLEDLAAFTHIVTRLKVAANAADDPGLSPDERDRGRILADRLSLRVLSRAWQMLLKGIPEVREAARPLAAADMVLVRLAYAADLPTPDEALRMLQGEARRDGGGEAGGFAAAEPAPRPVPLARGLEYGLRAPEAPARTPEPPAAPAAIRAPGAEARAPAALAVVAPAARAAEPMQAPLLAEAAPVAPRIQGIADIVALAEARRDLPMKVALERCVRLIRFEPGRIELALTGDAPGNFAGELGRKLNGWTGQRWMITVGREEGAPTLHETRQAARAQLVTDARADPLVAAVLSQFPGAEIVDVRVNGELEPQAFMVEEAAPSDPDESGED